MKLRKAQKKKLASLILVLLVLSGGWLLEQLRPTEEVVPASFTPIEDMLKFHVVDVGQGSSTLIQTATKTVLIDGGETHMGDELSNYLAQNNIQKIDLMVASHLHTDHYGGLIEVLSRFEVGELMVPALTPEQIPQNDTYDSLLAAIDKNGCPVTRVWQKQSVSLGEAKLTLLGPFLPDEENPNNTSLCFRIDAGEASFLVTGDGEGEVERALADIADVDVDVLVAGHHGSSTSSKSTFLKEVTPIVTAISVGAGNSYNHPNQKVVERLAAFGPIYRTDLHGDIVYSTDGKVISIHTKDGEQQVLDAA